MIAMNDNVRADVAMTPEKVYYRFTTEDTIEDGELPGLHERFESEVTELLNCFAPGAAVNCDISPVKFQLFVNNVIQRPTVLNKDTLRAFTRGLARLYDEFDFLAL